LLLYEAMMALPDSFFLFRYFLVVSTICLTANLFYHYSMWMV
jgi:hypothetical protein